jgi:predicted Rossmann fold flavoprotein
MPVSDSYVDIVIIGAGAAGLSAAIFAAEHAQELGRPITIVLIEGARKPGAKILVSGGGRCNVTNERVTSADYNGGPQPLIRNVLRAFDERRTLRWMQDLGVELKLEPTGKYFPVTDKARSVLDALLRRIEALGINLQCGIRVSSIVPRSTAADHEVRLAGGGRLQCRNLVVATGGLALPKSGSDGAGLNWMRQLGHSVVATTPALVPLLAEFSSAGTAEVANLSGVTHPLRLTLINKSGKHLASTGGSTLFTHFGLSGPAPLDISRHVVRYMMQVQSTATLHVGHPELQTLDEADKWLQRQATLSPTRLLRNALAELLPDRLSTFVSAGVEKRLGELRREERLKVARQLAAMPVIVTGNRGYSFAEVTAGGVELSEVDVRTMHSRRVPGLFLCGELLDVDGRIGGFNFQWAWASGYLAGRGAVDLLS